MDDYFMFEYIDFDNVRVIDANNVAYKTQPRIVNTFINKLYGCEYYIESKSMRHSFYSKEKTRFCIMYKREYQLEVITENIKLEPLKKITIVAFSFYNVENDKVVDDNPTKHARLFCNDNNGIGCIRLFFSINFKNDKEYFARTFMKCVLFENSYVNFEQCYF